MFLPVKNVPKGSMNIKGSEQRLDQSKNLINVNFLSIVLVMITIHAAKEPSVPPHRPF